VCNGLPSISLSAISARFNNFRNRVTRLLLALDAGLWELAGTILGTVPAAVDHSGTVVL
jgi:hypothetical protein